MTVRTRVVNSLWLIGTSHIISWFFVGVAVIVGFLVVGCLRAYCALRLAHDWEEYEATEYQPHFKECRRCGKDDSR